MIISVASGKGGTGKTTVATNLVRILDEEVALLDCDVEEPNAHLFLNPEIHSSEKAFVTIPVVDPEKCDGCGACVKICRFRALTVVAGSVMVFPELCHSCGGCTVVCPEQAISDGQRELGVVEYGTKDNVTFVKGCLRIGEVMAPPLIDKVRESINPDQLTIIDAPPGTSCPVISAMRDVDCVLLVTEPTPFGLNDLILAVETVRALGVPFGIVVNRAGVGDLEVYDFAKRENIPILMEIPFDLDIAKAYSKGKMMVDEFPHLRDEFILLYNRIKDLVASKEKLS